MQATCTIPLFILFSALLSCNPEKITTQTDKDGVVTQLPFLWKSSVSDGPLSTGLYRGYIIDNRGVLAMAVRKSSLPKVNGEYYLQLKDLETGNNLWSWGDFHNNSVGSLHRSIGLYSGSMLLHAASTTYLINTQTGTTTWKTRSPELRLTPYPAFLGDRYFLTGNSAESTKKRRIEPQVFEGNVRTGELKEVVMPRFGNEYAYTNVDSMYYRGSMLNMEVFNRNGVDYLIIPHTEPAPKDQYNHTRGHFGLFNLTENKWVYERVPIRYLEEGGATACLRPIVQDDKVYLTSLTTVGCFELMTGKEIWRRNLTDMFTGFIDFILVGNKLLLNGDNATLYCVNANSGSQLWTQKASAITSDLYHQDGIVYYIYTKYLLAVDIQTGKLLWDMPSPDIKGENRHDSWFTGFVTGLPAKDGKKGRIFASTNYNVYCFEAVK